MTKLAGQKFGRLTAICYAGLDENGRSAWWAECDCGEFIIVLRSNLRPNGHTSSCGCLRRETKKIRGRALSRQYSVENGHKRRIHGHSSETSGTYVTWESMIQRCENPHHKGFKNYGGRGISICQRWRSGFLNFLADMGERPKGHSIDRMNPDGNYEPGNCRWATPIEQRRNRSRGIQQER